MLTKLIQKQNNTMLMSMRSFSAATAKYDMVVIGGGPGGKKKQFKMLIFIYRLCRCY